MNLRELFTKGERLTIKGVEFTVGAFTRRGLNIRRRTQVQVNQAHALSCTRYLCEDAPLIINEKKMRVCPKCGGSYGKVE